MKRSNSSQSGFTIIELMIALSVLSIILLMGSVILISVGKIYTKGVNTSNAQNADRTILNDITTSLQFSGQQPVGCTPTTPSNPAYYSNNVTCAMAASTGTPASGVQHDIYAYCIGTTRYTYVLNAELGVPNSSNVNNTPHVLWKDTLTSSSDTCVPIGNMMSVGTPSDGVGGIGEPGTGSELMPNHMRLTRFYVTPVGGTNTTYAADVWLAFGDDDLLHTATNDSGSCVVGSGNNSNCAGYVNCRGSSGQEYCAYSMLSTTIIRRVQ